MLYDSGETYALAADGFGLMPKSFSTKRNGRFSMNWVVSGGAKRYQITGLSAL